MASEIIPLLGEIEFEESILYYDSPLLFTVIAKKENKRYLGFFAKQKEIIWTYWFTPISDENLGKMLNGEISVYSALTALPILLEVDYDSVRGVHTDARYRTVESLSEEILPEKDFFITEKMENKHVISNEFSGKTSQN